MYSHAHSRLCVQGYKFDSLSKMHDSRSPRESTKTLLHVVAKLAYARTRAARMHARKQALTRVRTHAHTHACTSRYTEGFPQDLMPLVEALPRIDRAMDQVIRWGCMPAGVPQMEEHPGLHTSSYSLDAG